MAVVRFLILLLLLSLSALATENSQTASRRKLATHWYVWDAIESNRRSPLWTDTIKTLPTRFYLDKMGMMVLKDTVDIVATKTELDGKADTISLGADSVVCTDGSGHLMTWIEATKLTWLENVESDIQAQLDALGVVDTIKVGNGMTGGGKGKEVTIKVDSTFFATKFFVGETLSTYQQDSDTSTFDATKTWVNTRFVGGQASITSAVTVANTTDETQLIGLTIPANTLTAGSTLRIEAYGVGGDTLAVPVMTWRCRIGPTTLTGNVVDSITFSPATTRTDQPWFFHSLMTVRLGGAIGTITGNAELPNQIAAATSYNRLAQSAITGTVALDCTAENLLELTFQYGTAHVKNTLTCTNAVIEVVKTIGIRK